MNFNVAKHNYKIARNEYDKMTENYDKSLSILLAQNGISEGSYVNLDMVNELVDIEMEAQRLVGWQTAFDNLRQAETALLMFGKEVMRKHHPGEFKRHGLDQIFECHLHSIKEKVVGLMLNLEVPA